jgi:hypothetical protein
MRTSSLGMDRVPPEKPSCFTEIGLVGESVDWDESFSASRNGMYNYVSVPQ